MREREAGHREAGAGLELGDPAGDEEAALELILVDHVGPGSDQELAELGGDVAGRAPAGGEVDRDLPPAERLLAGGDDRVLERALLVLPEARVAGQEARGDRDAARVGELGARDPEVGGAGAQERMGQLDEDSGAIARGRVGARGAAMLEVVEGGQRQLDHVVARLAVEARDAGDAASVMLVSRVIETGRALPQRPIAQARLAHPDKFTAVGGGMGGCRRSNG